MSFAKTLATLQVANYTGLGALSIPTARTCWVCHNAHFPCQNYIKKTNDMIEMVEMIEMISINDIQ